MGHVAADEHQAKIQAQSSNKLYELILSDIKTFARGARECDISDAKKITGIAVATKGNAAGFDSKVRAELGLKSGPPLANLQTLIFKRVTEHHQSAQMQKSMAGFSGGARETLDAGGISKGGLVKPMFKRPDSKPPQGSSMLQRIAQEKREREGTTGIKRNRMSFEEDDLQSESQNGESSQESTGRSLGGKGKQHYRSRSDSPSVRKPEDEEGLNGNRGRDRGRDRSPGQPGKGRDRSPGQPGKGRDRSPGQLSNASTWENPSNAPSGKNSLASTPARTSVDQWDIVATGDPTAGKGRSEREKEWRSTVRGEDRSERSDRERYERSESRSVRPSDGKMSEAEIREREQMEHELDRDWYDNDEGGAYLDETGGYDPFEAVGGRELEKSDKPKKKMSAKATAYLADDDKWIENQLLNSGVVRSTRGDAEEEEHAGRVHLQVRDIKPPFLDGKQVFSKKQDAVATVRDPTSDLAKIARQTCPSIKAYRDKRDLLKSREKFWEIEGSAMGKLMGVKDKAPEEGDVDAEGEVNEDGDVNYKQNSQFKNLMSEKSEAQSEFAKTKTIKQQRESLPIFGCREELLSIIRENQIVVVVGETGSGKTTQMAQYIHEDGYSSYGKIGCTQPRRVAAMSVAKRVSEEVGCDLGKTVGYAIRFEDCTDESTLLKFMTDGILLRETLNEPDLDQYSCIIMDEAHERSLNTDVLFGILRKVVGRRRDMKLIVTSATMDSEKFSVFFGGVPIFHIPGRTFPVEVLHAKTPVEDYVEAAVKQIMQIHLSYPKGDILAFMTGQEDIDAVCFMVKERMEAVEDKAPPLEIMPIHSMLPSELQAKIFKAVSSGNRKVVVATNIAETSLTIDGIKYVIDCGYYKLKVYNPRMGMDSLQVTPESQANARQRMGRAGRTGPGVAWRLYTELAFNFEMLHNTIPEIQRTNLGNVILLLKSLGVQDLLDFDFMDPPPQENLLNSMYGLWILGALGNTGELTTQGRKMVEFPLDPSLSKMLIQAEELRCNQEVLIIVASLSVGGLSHIFYRPKERAEESDAAREKFAVPESDHLTMLHVYQQWKANDFRGDWCSRHFLQQKTLKKVREIRTQLQDIMTGQKMDLVSCGGNWDKVRQAVCSAYFTNAARMKGIGEYENLRTAIKCHLHPTSSLYGIGFTPDYVVYHELVMTSKEYMQCVSVVDPHWLAEQGPMFFQVKETSFEGRMANKRRAEEAFKQMEKDLLKQQEQQKLDRDEDYQMSKPKTISGTAIVIPGSQDSSGQLPRRPPKKIGL